MATLGVTQQTQTLNSIIGASDFGPVRLKATITAGNFTAGQVLGRLTANGKFTDYDALAADGSEVACAILLEDSDASVSDQTALLGFAGVYLEDKMTGLDAAGKLDLETKAIYFV